jgi:hypothetical protein
MAVVTNSVPVNIMSNKCRGYKSTKTSFISSLISKCNFLLIQEHWLASEQLSSFGKDVLMGRPFGGCTILWQANMLASMPVARHDNCHIDYTYTLILKQYIAST